jgi:hypothetical protein
LRPTPRDKKKKVTAQQGIAVWQKEAPAARNYYALHDKAAKGSIIELHNPVTKRTVYAEVLGKIPATSYSTNLVVILSPNTAKLLGAKDANFFVKIKYYTNKAWISTKTSFPPSATPQWFNCTKL